MSTPGFTAHDSLYRSHQYYATQLISTWGSPATVAPGFKFPPGGGGDCHEDCGPCGPACTQTCQSTCLSEPYPKSCCGSTETCCGGKCVDTTSDWVNCGACGNECPSGYCLHGVCQPCLPGLTLCGAGCVDLSGDPFNCGACGVTCTSGICCNGSCGTDCDGEHCCPAGQKCCSDGGCCPKGQPCCNTPLGGVCCAHKCDQIFGIHYCT